MQRDRSKLNGEIKLLSLLNVTTVLLLLENNSLRKEEVKLVLPIPGSAATKQSAVGILNQLF
jgi:hypothetical protein